MTTVATTPRVVLQRLRKQFGWEAFWVGTGIFLLMAGQALSLKTVTSLLSRSEYGTFVLAVSGGALFQSVVVGSLLLALSRKTTEAVRAGILPGVIRDTARIARRCFGVAALVVGALAVA